MRKSNLAVVIVAACGFYPVEASTIATKHSSTSTSTAQEDRAVARTREQVKMLDDLYKTAVVLIT